MPSSSPVKVFLAEDSVPIRQRVAANLHRGFTGLALQYKGGAGAFRLSNWTRGSTASCDYEAAAVAG